MKDSLESRMHANVQVRFGGGRLEKGRPTTRHLAGRLPYSSVVHDWRTALGVGRYTPGSARLQQMNAEAGGAVLRDTELSEEACERRRRTALELGLRPTGGCGRGEFWTEEKAAQLGSASDVELAQRLERSLRPPDPAGGRLLGELAAGARAEAEAIGRELDALGVGRVSPLALLCDPVHGGRVGDLACRLVAIVAGRTPHRRDGGGRPEADGIGAVRG